MQTDEAVQAAPARDEFLARLGHDLRNPLNALMSALAVLEAFPAGSAEAEEARHVIARSAERLRAVLDDRLGR